MSAREAELEREVARLRDMIEAMPCSCRRFALSFDRCARCREVGDKYPVGVTLSMRKLRR